MIRIEYLSADLFGLDTRTRQALSGQLGGFGLATNAAQVAQIHDPFLPAEREQLAKTLEAQATACSPPVRVLESIRLLATPNASCVVTEASPFVLGGPLKQLLATVQTIALAKQLSTMERPVVPVLWVRSDEHETRPLISARIVNRHHALQSIHLDRLSNQTTPVRCIELDNQQHGLGSLREVLRQLFGDYEHITAALDTLLPNEGESLSRAYTRAMYELFGDQGLIIIEPEDLREDLSRACATCVGEPLMGELVRARELQPLTQEVLAQELEPWLFHNSPSGRRALSPNGNEFSFQEEPGSRTRAELAAELVQAPADWHPAHLLESVARGLVLPVLAEVGGARELERHLLFHGARTAFDWPRPSFVPRLQATLVDGPCVESLERLELSVQHVLRCKGEIETHGIAPQATELLETLDQIAMDARLALKEQKQALLNIGPTLKPALRAATTELTAALRGLSKKVSYVAANRGGKLDRHRRRLSTTLCPQAGPQAQTLSPFPWIAREGVGWLGDLLREVDPFCGEHLAIYLD